MKANEIQIGDWVYSTFYDKPCKVEGVEQYEGWYASVKVTNVTGVKDINSLIPIPLTPEILEKNGFEKNWQDNFVYDNEDIGLAITFHPKETNYTNGTYDYIDIEKGCMTIYEMPIEFVHQLQHALCLCGVNIEFIV